MTSMILELIALLVNFTLLNYLINKSGSHNGLPIVALLGLAIITWVLLLFTIVAQIYISKHKATRH